VDVVLAAQSIDSHALLERVHLVTKHCRKVLQLTSEQVVDVTVSCLSLMMSGSNIDFVVLRTALIVSVIFDLCIYYRVTLLRTKAEYRPNIFYKVA